MVRAKKSKKPTIALRPFISFVETNPSRWDTYLVVKLKCEFAPDEKGIAGSSISLKSKDMVQLAQDFYGQIYAQLKRTAGAGHISN